MGDDCSSTQALQAIPAGFYYLQSVKGKYFRGVFLVAIQYVKR